MRLQRKQTIHPGDFISESPASFQRKWTKLLETCHRLKPGPRSQKLNEYGFSLLLANSMSLAPKIDEVKCVISDVNPDLAFFTETWLRDSIIENYPHIPGYHFTARNRTSDHYGGVGLYTKNSIKFKSLDYLQDPDFERGHDWSRPRGITCLIAGTVYHSQTVNDMAKLNHL